MSEVTATGHYVLLAVQHQVEGLIVEKAALQMRNDALAAVCVALRNEIARLNAILHDPAAVALNIKRGELVLPSGAHWDTDGETELRNEVARLRGLLAPMGDNGMLAGG